MCPLFGGGGQPRQTADTEATMTSNIHQLTKRGLALGFGDPWHWLLGGWLVGRLVGCLVVWLFEVVLAASNIHQHTNHRDIENPPPHQTACVCVCVCVCMSLMCPLFGGGDKLEETADTGATHQRIVI